MSSSTAPPDLASTSEKTAQPLSPQFPHSHPSHQPHLSPSIHRTTSGIEPIEPTIATGLSMIASQERPHHEEEESHLAFAFLRKERPLPGKNLYYCMLFGLFLVMFLAGWNDASQGPLLPSLQDYYHVDYLIIAIIWLANFVGFLTAGITNVHIMDRLGFGITATIGALSQGLGYVLMCWGGPYPLFVCAYLFVGFGLGLQDAQVNSLTSRLPDASTKMFLMHAVYGLGATVSPFVSTAFVQHEPTHVYYYFAVSLALAILTASVLTVVFRGRTEDQVVGKRLPDGDGETSAEVHGGVPMTTTSTSVGVESGVVTPVEKEARQQHQQRLPDEAREKLEGSGNKMKRIMRTPAIHFMAFYIMIYVGVEVTIGGWVTSFIVDERGGDSNAGYVTTGYFAGLTLGRVVLIPVTKLLGQHNAIYIYSAIAFALEFVVWFTNSIPGNAVAFAFIGFFLGPMYPIVMMVVTEIIPGELQAGSIGWIASLGQAGSAMMPLSARKASPDDISITGAISDRYGVWILQPLIIAFLVADVALWALVPRHR